MTDLWQRLKQRKLVQWAVAYVAAAFALLQGVDIIAQRFAWPDSIARALIIASVIGFFVVLLLAWYHGERGAQKVSSTELLILALVLVIGGGFIWKFAGTPTPTPVAVDAKDALKALATTTEPASGPDIPAKSIAVLPFENLSADKDNEYFASGIQDLILTKLADIGDLKVISRASTRKYASRPDDLKSIALQLGVATILEGSVQKAGNEVLINVQLIDANTDSHLWAESYTRDLKNIFGVEGEVAGKVADALKAKLSPDESATVASIPTRDPQAYTLYLKAQYASDQYHNVDHEPAHLLQASEYLNQAIAQDPKFALAYALLSRVQGDSAMGSIDGKDASYQAKAIANARKALALQPDLAEAHFALALALISGQSDQPDIAQSLKEIQTAAKLKPGDSEIATTLAGLQLAPTGDMRQMVAAVDKALRLDPGNAGNYRQSAELKMGLREYDGARQTLEHGLAVHPDDQRMRGQLAWLMVLTGDPAGARVQLAQIPADAQGAPVALVGSWLYSGDYAKALQAAEQAPQSKEFDEIGEHQLWIGVAAQLSGDTARAKAAFDQARNTINQALLKRPDSTSVRLNLARVEMWSGNRVAALQLVDGVIHEREARITKIMAQLRQAEGSRSHGPGVDLIAENAYYYELRAEILAHFGDARDATELLDRMLATPGTGAQISPALLSFDPIWDPIRKNPAFQALLAKYPIDLQTPVVDGVTP